MTNNELNRIKKRLDELVTISSSPEMTEACDLVKRLIKEIEEIRNPCLLCLGNGTVEYEDGTSQCPICNGFGSCER